MSAPKTVKKAKTAAKSKSRIYMFGYCNKTTKDFVNKRSKEFKTQTAYLNHLVAKDAKSYAQK